MEWCLLGTQTANLIADNTRGNNGFLLWLSNFFGVCIFQYNHCFLILYGGNRSFHFVGKTVISEFTVDRLRVTLNELIKQQQF